MLRPKGEVLLLFFHVVGHRECVDCENVMTSEACNLPVIV